MKLFKYLAFFICTIVVICGFLKIGYVTSYLDEEKQTTFFWKQYSTLQLQFYDPYASESDHEPIDRLPPEYRKYFADYCKYRFGITDQSTAGLEACEKKIPSYLR